VVPFLDKHFIDVCMTLNQTEKMGKVEKRILRESFEGYLPGEILWRQKDGMSDAVGTNWVGALRNHTESVVDDRFFRETRDQARGHNTPLTKEEAMYRELFWSMYGRDNDHLISEIWRPRWTTVTDPSARLLIDKSRA
jgi:asparagine synthase (glutamine-hydrolysing)